MPAFGRTVSKTEVLEVLWQRIPMFVVDISPGEVPGSSTVLLANVAAERLFGYEMIGSMRGLPLDELIPSDRRAVHGQHVEGYRNLPGHRHMGRDLELLGLRKNGSTFPIAIELIPTMLIDDVPCVICVAADMTDRIQGAITRHG